MRTRLRAILTMMPIILMGCVFENAVAANPVPKAIASFNMDSNPGWTAEGMWEYGKPLGYDGDPSSGYTGQNVYGYNLEGDYPDDSDRYYLTTTPIDCSDYTNVVLSFQRWLGVEYYGCDQAGVEVSNDGTSWTTAWEHNSGGFTDNAWSNVVLNISDVADEQPTVYIRWAMGTTDGSVTYCGWNIDDVEIRGVEQFPDFITLELPERVLETDVGLTDGGKVSVTTVAATNRVVNLAISENAEISIPTSVIIPAGATNATFDITVLDDTLLDGSQAAEVVASHADYRSHTVVLPVDDNETAGLVLSLSDSVVEGGNALSGTVTISAVAEKDVTVELVSDRPDKIPSGIAIVEAGQTNGIVTLVSGDDYLIDGTQAATITAHVQNWTDSQAMVSIIDDEVRLLLVNVSDVALEGGYPGLEVVGEVSIPGIAVTNIAVSLTVSDDSEIEVPAEVIIPAGGSSATFDISVVNDAETDGMQSATVYAQANSFETGMDSIEVLDDDVHHISVYGPTGDIPLFDPVQVSIQVCAIDGMPAYRYSDAITLHAVGDRGEITLSTTEFSDVDDGAARGLVSFGNLGNGVLFIASSGGFSGTNILFNVVGSEIAIPSINLGTNLVVAGESLPQSFIVSNSGTTDLEFEVTGSQRYVGLVDPALILHYTFDDDDGTVVVDQSGHGNDGIATNSFSHVAGVEGQGLKINGNANYDASGGHVLMPALDFGSMEELTVALWVKQEALHTGGQSAYISFGTYYDGGRVMIGNSYDDYYVFSVGRYRQSISNPRPVQNQFVHYALTYSNGVQHAYCNGELIGERSNTLQVGYPELAALGRIWFYGDAGSDSYTPLTAVYDDVRVYNRALSTEEIGDLYYGDPIIGFEGRGTVEPVVEYRFDGNAWDSSASDADGIVEGAELCADRSGCSQSAFEFDEGAYIRTATASGPVDLVGQVSMSGWIKPTRFTTKSGVGTMRTIMRKLSRMSFYGYAFMVSEDGRLVFDSGLSVTPDSQVEALGMDPLPLNEWSHVCMAYDGAQVCFYVNGSLVNTQAYNEPLKRSTVATLCIGSHSDENPSDFFYGCMDDLRLYDHALSATEVVLTSHGIDIPDGSWPVTEPGTGTIVPGGSREIVANFDASMLVAGDFFPVTFLVRCNDLANPVSEVSAAMLVLPPAPTIFVEPETTPGSSNRIYWGPVAGPVQYAVEMAASTNSPALQQSGWISESSYVFDGLSTDATYHYRVQASIVFDETRYVSPWSDWTFSTQVSAGIDGDGDGIPDGWEDEYFGGAGSADATSDHDGDGQSDLAEFIAGMNPTNSESLFELDGESDSTNDWFIVSWDSVPDRIYSVFWTSTLTNDYELLQSDIWYPQSSYTDEVDQAYGSGFYKVGVEME